MKNERRLGLFLAFTLGGFLGLQAQILNSEDRITVTLSDETTVNLYGAATALSDEKSGQYYYMPCNLRLSKNLDGTPQFLFLKFTSEESEEQGGISGALLHMLMEYGLTQKQEEELQQILKSKYDGAVLKGAADVRADGENSVRVVSAILNSKDRTRTLVLSGKAPLFPGNKMALAAELDEKGAQLFSGTLEETKSIADLSISLAFKYSVRFPAARGYIKEDWSKFDSLRLVDSAYYSKQVDVDDNTGEKALNGFVGGLVGGPIGAAIGFFGTKKKKKTHFTYDEMREMYKFLEENEVIEMNFEENLNDERVDKIREAFFQHFLNSFTEKAADVPPVQPSKDEQLAMPNIRHGNSYKFRREIVRAVSEKRTRLFNLNYRMAVDRDYQITENLTSWYDGVKDNPKCVGIVNLNDPFFQHRDVNVILDLDAEEMMGKELNYVTVSLRKDRNAKGANDFSHQLTFDKRFFEENGNRTTVTYSKAQDANPDEYQYKVQWSLRGGNLFPEGDTTWTTGSWQGITLAPPVQPRLIRFEADLDELKDLDIRNATLQLRYYKFGKEVETNLNISLYSEEPFAEKTIFMDRNTQGYAYRLIFTHKRQGIMAMEYQPAVNLNYFFAVVPPELQAGDPTFLEKLIEEGKKIMGGSQGGEVSEADKVLDKFKDVIMVDESSDE